MKLFVSVAEPTKKIVSAICERIGEPPFSDRSEGDTSCCSHTTTFQMKVDVICDELRVF